MVSRRALLPGLVLPALVLPAVALPSSPPAAAQAPDPWGALRGGGHVALMRHATAPGGGDPPGFRLDACGTQRNLPDAGRAEAARIGGAFRAAGLAALPVFSSQWCRCLETARLLGLGPVAPLPALNSFFGNGGEREAATAALRRWIADQAPRGAAVLVTHQVNVTALTGIFPAPGEVAVLRADSSVLGRWRLPG
ncbi:histidine phosphatase family protein [Pseudoroseomonas rhizosphaerae]|uniref:Histidine phosphatase family protein n=1 Tax=Teichococcus rhizosphaerae TaxID=1335062 RepID=A0A2C7AD11_9PROT|nr:histidine phosphatase family protein [Pseudoroseomonas rhizosphaerae]PHK95325.1 histidine phosphatase family protein [Pseudoroseomonas rhizosphaerae]